MPECVLDASAFIALVNQEPGAEKVKPLLPQAVIGAVNYCETIQRLRRGGMPEEEVRLVLAPLVPTPVPFDEGLAYLAASVYDRTRAFGLSFGDCACLGLALSRNMPAVTAEREWDKVDVGVKIIRIR